MVETTEMVNEIHETASAKTTGLAGRWRAFLALGWASLAFAALQSLCTLMIGLGGARLIIGLLSAAAASSVFSGTRFLHQNALRRPMIVFALLGAVVNLIVIAQIRHLRNRPAARWRLDLAALPGKLRQERWQIGLSVVTLGLLVVEEWLHVVRHHRW